MPARDLMPIHRHGDARVVVVASGCIVEETFGAARVMAAGEAVFRPPFFGHAVRTGSRDARYVKLPVTDAAWRAHVAAHGWTVGFGRLPDSLARRAIVDRSPACGDAALALCRPAGADLPPVSRALNAAAEALRRGDVPAALIARRAGLPPYQLSRRFKRAFGVAPSVYAAEARVDAALGLMLAGDARLADVAARAGFADQAHMTRAFRRFTGATPRQAALLIAAG